MKKILIFCTLSYIAMFVTIWIHEIAHAAIYFLYDCKTNLFDVSVPFHFGNSNPYPVIVEKAKELSPTQIFNVSIAGIIINIVLGTLSLLVLRKWKLNSQNKFLQFFISVFAIANLAEASSYLTISNIVPVSDMRGIIQDEAILQLPFFILGLGTIVLLYGFIMRTPSEWRKGLLAYTSISMILMGGLRVYFTLF